MGAGIAVTFCEHFKKLRRRVESEANVKASLIAIHFEEDDCWVYNLVTKQNHYDLPEKRDLLDCLIQMREHALVNQVLEIHMPRLGARLDHLEWKSTEEMILEVFRNQALRVTVYEHNPPNPRRKQAKSRASEPGIDELTLAYGNEDTPSGDKLVHGTLSNPELNISSGEDKQAPISSQRKEWPAQERLRRSAHPEAKSSGASGAKSSCSQSIREQFPLPTKEVDLAHPAHLANPSLPSQSPLDNPSDKISVGEPPQRYRLRPRKTINN